MPSNEPWTQVHGDGVCLAAVSLDALDVNTARERESERYPSSYLYNLLVCKCDKVKHILSFLSLVLIVALCLVCILQMNVVEMVEV